MERKTVDVIIPTYKPNKKFARLLQMLERQSYPINRIIIVNTERRYLDETGMQGKNIRVCHITKDAFDHGGTRNLGVSLSDADYFLMMTDDAVPADQYLVERLAAALNSSSQLALAYARQLATEESGADERFARSFNYPAESCTKTLADLPTLGIKTYFASNVCCMYRREAFDALGGFIDHTIFNEDMIYACKAMHAGYGVRYCAEARVYHAHHYSAMQQLHRNFDMGVSQADHPEVFAGIRSEGEGVRMVKANACALLKKGKVLALPDLFVKSACKYAGYRLGKAYRKLPRALVLRLSMNRNYWKEDKGEKA